MGVAVELPITKHIDIAGAIFLLENTLVYQWMKQIDVSHHFIWEYIDYRIVKLIFVHSEETLCNYLLRT